MSGFGLMKTPAMQSLNMTLHQIITYVCRVCSTSYIIHMNIVVSSEKWCKCLPCCLGSTPVGIYRRFSSSSITSSACLFTVSLFRPFSKRAKVNKVQGLEFVLASCEPWNPSTCQILPAWIPLKSSEASSCFSRWKSVARFRGTGWDFQPQSLG